MKNRPTLSDKSKAIHTTLHATFIFMTSIFLKHVKVLNFKKLGHKDRQLNGMEKQPEMNGIIISWC